MKLSLVSCTVALYPATSSSARIAFHTLNRKTGNRVKRQFIDPETRDVVETDAQVKGYAVTRGSYVTVEDDELDAIRIESTHTLAIESFVPREQIDERYLETPYYLAPEDKVAQEAFAVIRDAMADKGKAGVARIVLSHRERMVLLEPHGKGVLATLLRYPYEIRPSAAFFDDLPAVEVPKEMRELAGHIIDTKSGNFDPDAFHDRYEEAVMGLIHSKQSGQEIRLDAGRETAGSNVVSLMDALKRSLAGEGTAGDEAKPASKSRQRRTADTSSTVAATPAHKPGGGEPAPKKGAGKVPAAKAPATRTTARKSAPPVRKAG